MRRFAFYGRVSTEDQQDPASSRGWQLSRATQLIEPTGGKVVAEFFDIGQSRSLPWARRPEASRLLTVLADPDRGFDAVVLGEPQRAFYGNQFGLTFPVFVHYGVELWVPEVGGAVDPGSDAHEIVMSLYGGMSKGERNRIKTRVRSSMQAQVVLDGRFQGGRPPYGYRIADGELHPNPAKAAQGQRLRHLEPDPMTAPIVAHIFETSFLKGAGVRAIARQLTAQAIPCPSASDPGRNRHRLQNGPAWAHTAVRAILTNPRYTGFQVWNRQRRHEILISVHDVAAGHETRMRWNDRGDWVWSKEATHQALVTMDQWQQAQELLQVSVKATNRSPKAGRHYVLAGMIRCGTCHRHMEGVWNHGRPYYRCQLHRDDPIDRSEHPNTIYVREDALLPGLDAWLAELFDAEHLDQTCDALAAAIEPDGDVKTRHDEIRRRITELDTDSRATAPSCATNPTPRPRSASGSLRPPSSAAASKPCCAPNRRTSSRATTSRRSSRHCETSPQCSKLPTRLRRPRSTPSSASPSPTARTDTSSSRPDLV
jgi:DNA invertase Pin-like site-specific DNA recombinase